MLSLNVVQQHIIVLRGRSRIVSYCIQVKRGDEIWRVFQTEEQISKLSAALLQPSIEGHLYKKASSSIVPKWNKRYFKFVGSTLYYSNEMNPGFDIIGTSYKKIEIFDARIMPTNDIEAHMGNNIPADFNNSMKGMFEIHKRDKKAIYLKAPSKGEMVKWLEALRAESDEHRRAKSAPATPLARTPSPILPIHPSSPQLPPRRLQKKESSKNFRSLKKSTESLRRSSDSLRKGGSDIIMQSSFDEEDAINFKLERVNSLLHNLCSAHPDSDVLRSFLLVNAYPNEDYPQMRMMLDAVKENNFSLIENLHEQYGVAINFSYKGSSLFIEACRSGSIPIVKYILTTEPESSVEELLYKKDNFDSSPLHYACISSLPLACMLVSVGVVEKFVEGFGPWTPLHHLAQHTKAVIKEQIDYLDKLISNMSSLINNQDLAGRAPLHICAKQSNIEMAFLLIQKGAKIDLLTIQKKTFLHLLASNVSTKSHDMMVQILQYLFKNIITLEECETQMQILELRDQEGKTAIQYANEKSPKSPHIKHLSQHYAELENFKFSLIFTEILYQCGQKSIMEIKNTAAFQALIQFLCSACNSNDYHSDVRQLIRRSLDLIARCENSLLDLNIPDKERQDFMGEVMRDIYPFVHSLFLKKKLSIDSILTRCLKVYSRNVSYAGFGISDSFWNKVQEKTKLVESQRQGIRKSVNAEGDQLLVKRAIEILAEIPELVKPSDKVNCLREIFDMFECLGADEEFSLLSYLMVRSAHLNIQWSAEIDYIMTFSPNENCMMLKGMQMFFLTSWMQLKNGIFQVEEVTTTESLTIIDVKCLWEEIKETSSGQWDISLLHGLFFACAHNTHETKFVTVDGCFSPGMLSNSYMKSILERLHMTIQATDHGTTEVVYGEFLDSSVFARIGCAFYGMLEEKG